MQSSTEYPKGDRYLAIALPSPLVTDPPVVNLDLEMHQNVTLDRR